MLNKHHITDILIQSLGLIAQTPTHESTKRDFFLQIFGFNT
jgi:hypothetical protein